MADFGGPNVLLKALKATAEVLDPDLVENLEHELANGKFFVKLLRGKPDLEATTSIAFDEESTWSEIKERLETVFGPNLINWRSARVYSPQSRALSTDRRQTLGGRLTSGLRRESYCPQAKRVDTSNSDPILPNLNESHRHGFPSNNCSPYNYNKDQLSVALLALYICCVNDQKEQVYAGLYKLNEKNQRRIQNAFQYLLGM